MITQNEYSKMQDIKEKMEDGTAKTKEIRHFLDLIIDSGNEIEIRSYIHNIGFNSIDEYKEHLDGKIENQETVKNLAIVGGGLLLAFLLLRK
jgi:hypothetical protein